MKRIEIQNKLNELRIKWKNNPQSRKTTELQARALKQALALCKDNI